MYPMCVGVGNYSSVLISPTTVLWKKEIKRKMKIIKSIEKW